MSEQMEAVGKHGHEFSPVQFSSVRTRKYINQGKCQQKSEKNNIKILLILEFQKFVIHSQANKKEWT